MTITVTDSTTPTVRTQNVTLPLVVQVKVATPTASPLSGSTVSNNSTVTLSDTTEGATIYFTTDSSTPTTNSSHGTGVTITGTAGATVTVKAFATASGLTDSDIATFTYTISGGGSTAPSGGGSGGSGTAPTVQTASASSVAATSATLNSSVTSSGSSNVIDYGFLWGTDQNNLAHILQVGTDNHSGAFTATLANLTPGTTYYFQAYANNASGPGDGTVMSFTTTATQTPATPAAPTAPPAPVTFSDVPVSGWVYDAVSNLGSLGYITGYPDGHLNRKAPSPGRNSSP